MLAVITPIDVVNLVLAVVALLFALGSLGIQWYAYRRGGPLVTVTVSQGFLLYDVH